MVATGNPRLVMERLRNLLSSSMLTSAFALMLSVLPVFVSGIAIELRSLT